MNIPGNAADQHQHRFSRGFFPLVFGRHVKVDRAGGLVFIARDKLSVERGGGQWFVAGGDLAVRQAGGAALVARTARVESGFIGALVARDVQLAAGARVLLQATPAVLLSAAAGFIAGWVACGRRRSASA